MTPEGVGVPCQGRVRNDVSGMKPFKVLGAHLRELKTAVAHASRALLTCGERKALVFACHRVEMQVCAIGPLLRMVAVKWLRL